ncbi:MAG: hypothetical protein VKL39_03830 [Leptolyngbyaceae bacterium]|nr:hypothetical protein [Leptolyngbyaceae bacterium]
MPSPCDSRHLTLDHRLLNVNSDGVVREKFLSDTVDGVFGIFLGWGWVILHLCQLWLGLSALGYVLTGWGVRSRTFLIAGGCHLIGIALLPLFSLWPFLFSGIIIAGTLLFLSEVQWDMRPPSDKPFLSDEENEFNQAQQARRSAKAIC